MQITSLMTNRVVNPLGFQLGRVPRLSWVTVAEGREQADARIEVSLDGDFSELLFGSGMSGDIDSACYPLELELAARTRYYWRVTVKTDGGEQATSRPAWFETAKLAEPWSGIWISPDLGEDAHAGIFTNFTASKAVRSARAYVSGLGVYEIYLNGGKAGDEYLAPGLCAYDKWIPYQTYDITGGIKDGENHVEIILGNGWYKGRYGLKSQGEPFRYGDELAAICEIDITYEDGERQLVASNTTDWRARPLCVTDSGIFDGERRDDTLDTGVEYGVKPGAPDIALLEPCWSHAAVRPQKLCTG